MHVVGIMGGIASGKSLVAQRMKQLGAVVIDADQIGHEVLLEPQVEQAVAKKWGPAVIDRSGHVDRAALAKIVFSPPPTGPRELEYLEQLTHPRIKKHLQSQLSALASEDPDRVVVLDAPVLLKAGWDKFCEKVVYVKASRALRLKRAMERGWSEEDFNAREAAQESLDKKLACADLVIDNSASPEETYSQVDQWMQSIR